MASAEHVDQRDEELKGTGYEIFIGFLSILSILNVAMIYLADDPNLDTVIYALNGLFSVIFLGDFTYRLFTADSKARYFLREFGWADLFASLPFPQAKVLRIFRLIRVYPPPPRLWHQRNCPQPGQGSCRERPVHIVADGDPGARIRQPLDSPPGAIRARTRTSPRHPTPFGMSSSPSPQLATATSSR